MVKARNIFLIFFGLWIVEFALTIVGINLFGLEETGKVSRYLFSFGFIGYVFMFSSSIILLLGTSFLISRAWNFSVKKLRNEKIPKMIYGPMVSFFILVAVYRIINNFYWVVKAWTMR